MDPFIAQLKELCARHPTRAKWVFVPSHGVGRTIGDRLVLGGTNWANLRFVTPLDVALPMGAPFLVERGIDPSEEGLGPALMMRLLLGLPGAKGAGYFRPLADQPQLAVALWGTLRELRAAGVRAADLKPDAFASVEKHAELAALLAAYESFLATHRRGDRATVFEEALQHPDWCPIQAADCWTEVPDVIWPPVQRRLIEAMPGERIAPAVIHLPGLSRPRRLADARVDSRHPPSSSANITFFHAGGAEAEIEEVFRRILTSGRSLDEAEIVSASPQYAPLIWEKAMRYDWPVTIAQGIPAAMTRPGRALLAFTEWVEDDFAAGRLRRILQSGDVQMGDAVTITAGRAARLLVKAQAAWGRDTYRLSMRRLATSSRAGAKRDDLAPEVREGLEQRAKQAEDLAAWIDGLVVAVPVPGADGAIDLPQLVDCARDFIDRYAARGSALDAMAASSLSDAIADLRALGEFRCSLTQAIRFLRERVESVSVGADRPRPGHLHVSSFATAAVAGRPLTFVVGLEEGRVFPAPFEDPILLDAERERVSASLSRAADRTDEAVYIALNRLAVMAAEPGAAITLSYSCRDLREYRETYASWLMLHVFRNASGNAAATYKDLHEHLGPPKSCVPESSSGALSEARWWLHGISRAGETSRPTVFERYPSLQAGATAAAARASDNFTEFDGHVPAAGKVLDPSRPAIVISPTQLEDAAECPFRHFLKRGLGVDAIETGDRDRDVWLDPLQRGSLLHDLYAHFMRRCRDEDRRVRLPEDHDWLQERGREMLRDLAVEMPPPSAEVGDRETRLFLDDLALFVEEEARRDSSRTPVGFEVAFGRADAVDEEPLAQAEPVVIDVGGGMKLKIAGRIDRIDQIGPAAFEIVDYKTGGFWADGWQGTFAGGTRLQHALYGLAAVELLRRKYKKATVAGAQYYFPSAKGKQERKAFPTQPVASVGALLADLRDVISSGLFVHAPDMDACRWCDFGHACGEKAASRAEAKLIDPTLAPFVKLVTHE